MSSHTNDLIEDDKEFELRYYWDLDLYYKDTGLYRRTIVCSLTEDEFGYPSRKAAFGHFDWWARKQPRGLYDYMDDGNTEARLAIISYEWAIRENVEFTDGFGYLGFSCSKKKMSDYAA